MRIDDDRLGPTRLLAAHPRGNLAAARGPGIRKSFPKTLALTAVILLLHLTFVSIGGYPLTVAPFAVLIFIIFNYRFTLPKGAVLLWIFFLALPFLNLYQADTSTEVLEFVRTYALWGFAITMVLLASQSGLRQRDATWIARATFAALAIISFYSIAQVVLYRYLGTDLLYNPFGTHQYLRQYDVSLYSENVRAPGFYLEPSFDAFVITSLLVVLVVSRYRAAVALLVGGVALLFVGSFSGLLVYGFVLGGYLLLYAGMRRRAWAGSGVLLGAAIAAHMLGTTGYIWERITSGSVAGTSTHYRLVAPLEIVRDVLGSHVTGLPFGTVEDVVYSYGLENGLQQGSTLDNGFYLLLFYFGWLAAAAAVLAVLACAVAFRKRQDLSLFYVLGYILISMNYSGGIMAPEYVFVIVLVIYSWRARTLRRTASPRDSVSGRARRAPAPLTRILAEQGSR